MENNQQENIDDEDDYYTEDYDDDYADDIVEAEFDVLDHSMLKSNADEWEDFPAAKAILDKLPQGWSLLKVVGYTGKKFEEIETWCRENCRGAYKKVGWSSHCSYTVCVAFENSYDALVYRLRWH